MRKPREVVPHLPHHVCHRGNNRRRLFSYPVERWSLLRLVTDAARRTGCEVHAWCLLDNHLHLLATPPTPEALPEFVQSWAQRFAQRRNRARGGSGKLFEQRFFSRPLRTDDEVAIATAYVELNPVRAGLTARPELERWSSAALHLSTPPDAAVPIGLWRPSAWFLGLGQSPDERALRYGQWLAASEAQRREYDAALGRFAKRHGAVGDFSRRLRRPDGTRARERGTTYGLVMTPGPLLSRTQVIPEG